MRNVPQQLAELIGEHRVSTEAADLSRHSRDLSAGALLAARSGLAAGSPVCVARPASTEQVARVVRWANLTATPLVPFGGGSDVLGAIEPVGAVVVDMRALNEIVAFDERSRLVTVQAGMLGPELAEALAAWGYMLGHEPQSIALSTVGGWVSTRATGQLSARFGGIEDLMAGLEAVLPDGTVVRSKIAPRRAAGPDLAGLLIGAEGSLGIVTEVTLRVAPIPDPAQRTDVCLRFEHMTDGVAACRNLAQSDLRPTLVRLYDADDASLFLRNHPDEPAGPLLLLSFDGTDAERRSSQAISWSAGSPGNDKLVDHWWNHRNDAVDEYVELMAGGGILGPHALVDTIEVSGTWSVLRALYHDMKASLAGEADLVGCHLSHVYPDGACLYFTLASACSDDDTAAKVHERWWETAMASCLNAGGSISHHHGIGRVKAPWLADELGGFYDVLVAVKRALDPNNIMNPGVLGL